MHEEWVEYRDGDRICEGFFAWEPVAGKRPCVIVCHAWGGQGDTEREKARELARLGYVGFAIDVYGKGRRGDPLQGNERLMQPWLDDRAALRRALLAGLDCAARHQQVDERRVAALGYCFGGLCALDLARAAPAGLRAVVTFHAVLTPPRLGAQPPIDASVLVLHGFEDPVAPAADVLALARELTAAGADWQVHVHGHAMHAFSFPGANLPHLGIRYDANAASRSAAAADDFLRAALAG
ncbi:dienelactone hydrolase family protein [Vulgatibacter sp.]|uniref:dienelactone hydrolase family protein n=1 Tax=Vulgatibacter sp. TaxID=1971226 RepID=UPI0035626FC1